MMRLLAIALLLVISAKAYLYFSPENIDAQAVSKGHVNVYSSRKEILVKELFDEFTDSTGIEVNFVTDDAGKLISRLKSEGENTPADLFLTSDVGNLEFAKDEGLLQPIISKTLNENISSDYRDPDNSWYGLSIRARAIFYSKYRVYKSDLSTYEDLADPKWKGKVLVRSSSNIYNQSLLASMIEANGEEETLNWAKGLVSNFARTPQGGDTDQIRAIASGEGDVAIANTYYYGRLEASEISKDRSDSSKVGIFFPNQDGRGAHVNISGGGVTKYATNREEAIKLLEYLSSKKAQKIYADKNHEYPISVDVPASKIVSSWGGFKKDKLPMESFIKYRKDILKIADKAGWR